MAHTVYTTSALVLSARNIGEANRLFTILTRDVGTVVATAQSIRLQKSKLRYALQPLSLAEVSLVRGRGGWRITNAYPRGNLFFGVKEREKRELAIKVVRLLHRLLVGETPDPNLFDTVESGFQTLQELPASALQSFELVFVAKILMLLGYGTDSEVFTRVANASLEDSNVELVNVADRRSVVREINAALAASGL